MTSLDFQKPAGVVRIVYKQIVHGDIRKFQAESNDSPTGGGARDLRFSPYTRFSSIFRRMFPSNESNGIFRGDFHSIEGEREITRPVFFHPPTSARPHEGRIANVDKCLPIDAIPGDEDVILMIIQRDDGTVWPHFVSINSLRSDDWDLRVSNVLINCFIAERRQGVSMVGFVDFETGEVFCNGT